MFLKWSVFYSWVKVKKDNFSSCQPVLFIVVFKLLDNTIDHQINQNNF